ncbi:MAG: flagellar hook-length control protein FliK [Silvanigrellaceae bacterium]
MINQSRLSQLNTFPNARSGQNDLPNLNSKLAGTDADSLSTTGQLLAGGPAALGNTNLAGANSFTQLLELSKVEKPHAAQEKTEKIEKPVVEASESKGTRKKSEASDDSRKATKSKGKKTNVEESSEQTLSQLLVAQQDGMNAKTSFENENAVNQQTNPNQTTNQPKDLRLDKLSANANSLQDKHTGVDQLNGVVEAGGSLNGVMNALGSKLERLADMQKNGHLVADQNQGKFDEMNKLASKFDDVKFEFTPNENSLAEGKMAVGRSMDGKSAENSELLKKLAALEWNQNDLALRDLVAQQNLQEQAMEKLTLDKLDQLSQLKAGQLDSLQLQDAKNTELLKQMQMREALTSTQPQWTSYRDLTPEQKAMVDAMSNPQSLQNPSQPANGNRTGFAGEAGPAGRLSNPTSNGPSSSPMTQDSVAGLASMSKLSGEQTGSNPNRQDSSSGQAPGGRTNVIGEVAASKAESLNSVREKSDLNTENAQRARESERTREMARSAALRVQSIASELAVKGGGSAKVQIKDSQLGVVELRINMTDNNRVNIDLVANSDRIKQELEKQSNELKSGLEKHNVVLEGVRFATDTKLGDSGFQNPSQSDNSRANQQQQQQQNFSSFSQGNQNSSQQNFSGGERFFERPTTPVQNNAASAGGVRKNYSGKNDAQTNVQRAANGSLKVTA